MTQTFNSYYSSNRKEIAEFIPSDFTLKRVLEIGCGEGKFRENMNETIEYWGVEPSLNAANEASKKLYKVLIGRFEDIYMLLPDNYFDCIVCNPPYFAANTGRVSPDGEKQICRTLEIESIETFLKKIVELKSPKGKAFLTFPNQDAKRKDILLTYGFEEKREHASVSLFSLT